MDSINKEQEEDNFKDLHGKEATEKIQELVNKAGSCLFVVKSLRKIIFHPANVGSEN